LDEPINPEAWMWYREVIGGNRCPIVDTWWQTETGGIMISPLPGVTGNKTRICYDTQFLESAQLLLMMIRKPSRKRSWRIFNS